MGMVLTNGHEQFWICDLSFSGLISCFSLLNMALSESNKDMKFGAGALVISDIIGRNGQQ